MNILCRCVSFQLKKGVVHYLEIVPVTQVAQVNFPWFPSANLFEAFINNFLADQNIMRCVGGDLTPDLRDETVGGLLFWNMNLNLKSQKVELIDDFETDKWTK